jgi:low temperature requirement protein LtrA
MSTTAPLRRQRENGEQRASSVELFFDLVYVFAVTQLSHRLLAHLSAIGALETAVLLAMVWLVWVYTTWVTNYLDPSRQPVRLMLLVLMLGSLVMSAAVPQAFGDRGIWFGAGYAVLQIGRTGFALLALRNDPLLRTFQRVFVWCLVSGTLAVIGGLVHGAPRPWLWLVAVCVDLLGSTVGFRTPGLGRSTTADWTIEGNHFAERCQAFILIALGESIVIIGQTLAQSASVGAGQVAAFVTAFLGVPTLWWVYFDRSADDAARLVAGSDDPGRLGRSAYHVIHPVMVAGIIVTAAADELVVQHASTTTGSATRWLVCGGTALFLAGHAAFKVVIWRVVPWSRLLAVVALAVLGVASGGQSPDVLGGLALLIVLALIAADRWQVGTTWLGSKSTASGDSGA